MWYKEERLPEKIKWEASSEGGNPLQNIILGIRGRYNQRFFLNSLLYELFIWWLIANKYINIKKGGFPDACTTVKWKSSMIFAAKRYSLSLKKTAESIKLICFTFNENKDAFGQIISCQEKFTGKKIALQWYRNIGCSKFFIRYPGTTRYSWDF